MKRLHFLDTCICIEFLRGRLAYGYQEMRRYSPSDFQLPSIVAAELWYGAEHSRNPERERKIVGEFVEAFEIAPFDGDAARKYGQVRQLLGSEGNLIGDRDIMIASCALAHDAVLVSNNLSDFERVPGLKLVSWAETALPAT